MEGAAPTTFGFGGHRPTYMLPQSGTHSRACYKRRKARPMNGFRSFSMATGLAASVLAGWCGLAKGGEAAVQPIPFAAEAPTLDGRLDDAVWSQAATFSPFVIAGTKTPASIQTQVRACFTRRSVYLGIACIDRDASKLRAKHSARDAPLWQEDAVEIFINPNDQTYYQLIYNGAGAKCDLSYPRPQALCV